MEENRRIPDKQQKGPQLPPTRRTNYHPEQLSAGLRMPGSDVSVEHKVKQQMKEDEQRTRAEMERRKQQSVDSEQVREGGKEEKKMKNKSGVSQKALARKRKMKRLWTILGVEVLVLFVMLGGYALFYANSKYNELNYNEIDEEALGINEGLSDMPTEKYTTIALFGIDARDVSTDAGNRSDTIMIACINNDTKEVKITSIFRDTYVEIENPNEKKSGDDAYSKITHAYAVGGPQAAVATLNKNFDLQITEYVTVNFQSLTDVIDDLGGITVNVEYNEMEELNKFLWETAEAAGKDYSYLYETGDVTLDGIQATTYCRIRYNVGGDVARSERQREVVSAILDKAKKSDLGTLNKILDDVLPEISTSLSKKELVELLSGIFEYELVDSNGFPYIYSMTYAYDEILGQDASVNIIGNMENNVVLLHEYLYDVTGITSSETSSSDTTGTDGATEEKGKETYTPSEEVQRISKEIENRTGIYPPDDPEFRGAY